MVADRLGALYPKNVCACHLATIGMRWYPVEELLVIPAELSILFAVMSLLTILT